MERWSAGKILIRITVTAQADAVSTTNSQIVAVNGWALIGAYVETLGHIEPVC